MNSETLLKDGHNLRMSPEDYFGKLWNWKPLNGCFERNITIPDIDGFVEVNCHFLVLEGKTVGCKMPEGQKTALKRLSKLPEFTVIIFKGNPPNLDTVTEWQVLGNQKHKGNFQEFFNFIHEWFIWANKGSI